MEEPRQASVRGSRPTIWQLLVLTAYIGLGGVSLGIIALKAKASAWEHGGAVALLVPIGIWIGLIMRRRWAWLVSSAFAIATTIVELATRGPSVTWLAYGVVPLILLISPPMRRYIGERPR